LQTQDPHAPVNTLNTTSTVMPVGNINNNNNGATGGNLMSLNQMNLTTNQNVNFMPASNLNNQTCQLQPTQQQQEPAQQMLASVHVDDSRYGTELVMLYDYKAQAPDDLSVRRGELVYADLSAQTVDGWIWAWKAQKKCGGKAAYGFIPKAYTQPYRQNTSV
jgi:hypothetical protein